MKKLIFSTLAIVLLVLFFLYLQGLIGIDKVTPGMSLAHELKHDTNLTVTVKEVTIEQFDSIVGTISSRKTTMISAKIVAHVREIHVSVGEHVKYDQLLITLDDRDIQAKLKQARSQLTAAKANQTKAQSSYNRYQDLLKKKAVTLAEFEAVEAGLRIANAQVNTAEEAIRELEIMLGYAKIKAPYQGVVVDKMIEVGSLVSPGIPLIKLEDPGRIRLEAFIPEAKRSDIDEGDTLTIYIDSINENRKGTVEEIVPSADPRSRSFLVRVALESSEQLRPGMFGRLYLPEDSRKALIVPQEALVYTGQLEMVIVLENDATVTRLVRSGKKYPQGREILSGLTAGEKVLLNPEEVEL